MIVTQSFLSCLANPNLAVFLLLAGILLLYTEFNVPGAILPGSIGALLTMLALYGLSLHPIHPSAILLLVTGLALLLLELKSPARNLLAFAGTASIIAALATLTRSPAIHPLVASATGTIFAAVTLWLARIALLARRNKQIPRPRFTTPIPAPPRTGSAG